MEPRSRPLLMLLVLGCVLIVGIVIGSLIFVARTAGGAAISPIGLASAPGNEDGKSSSAARLSDSDWRAHLEARIDQLESRIQELSQSATLAPRERVSIVTPEQPSSRSFVDQHRAEIVQVIEDDRREHELETHLSKLREIVSHEAGTILTPDQVRDAQAIYEDFERRADAIMKTSPPPKDETDPRWRSWMPPWQLLREQRFTKLSERLGVESATKLISGVGQFGVTKL